MNKKTADAVVDGSNDPLGLSVLRRGVRTREAKHGAVGRKMGAHGQVIEFTAIVSLEGEQWHLKLSAHICVEGNNAGVNLRFRTQWESPHIVGIIID